jgi:hypothetical protein
VSKRLHLLVRGQGTQQSEHGAGVFVGTDVPHRSQSRARNLQHEQGPYLRDVLFILGRASTWELAWRECARFPTPDPCERGPFAGIVRFARKALVSESYRLSPTTRGKKRTVVLATSVTCSTNCARERHFLRLGDLTLSDMAVNTLAGAFRCAASSSRALAASGPSSKAAA